MIEVTSHNSVIGRTDDVRRTGENSDEFPRDPQDDS